MNSGEIMLGVGGVSRAAAVGGAAGGLVNDGGGAGEDAAERRIEVSGEAVVYVRPDRAVLRFGVETRGEDLERARAENSGKVEGVFAVMERYGIEEKDVQTSRMTIDPQYSSYSQGRELLGYVVRNSLSVTVHELPQVEDLTSDLLEAGVNQFQGIGFETSELLEHRREARRMAVKAARQKAQDMTAVVGEQAGRPLSIVEAGSGGSGRPQSQNVLMEAAVRDPGGAGQRIASGQIPVRERVSAVFELAE